MTVSLPSASTSKVIKRNLRRHYVHYVCFYLLFIADISGGLGPDDNPLEFLIATTIGRYILPPLAC
jgi:hypothetical protein